MTDVFESRVPPWHLWTTGLLIAMGAVLSSYNTLMEFRASGTVSPLGLFSAGCFVFIALTSGTWIWNRMRSPLLVIDDELIQFSPFARSLRPAICIAIGEIDALLPSSQNRVVLRLRSGKVRRFTLLELRKSDRRAAREAIQRRVPAAPA